MHLVLEILAYENFGKKVRIIIFHLWGDSASTYILHHYLFVMYCLSFLLSSALIESALTIFTEGYIW